MQKSDWSSPVMAELRSLPRMVMPGHPETEHPENVLNSGSSPGDDTETLLVLSIAKPSGM